jgi:hypothetical protein
MMNIRPTLCMVALAFFTGTDDALRYLRVLKECNLNNAEIERGGH